MMHESHFFLDFKLSYNDLFTLVEHETGVFHVSGN